MPSLARLAIGVETYDTPEAKRARTEPALPAAARGPSLGPAPPPRPDLPAFADAEEAAVTRLTSLRSRHHAYLAEAAPPESAAFVALDAYVANGDSLWFNRYLRGEACGFEDVTKRLLAQYQRQVTALDVLIRGAPPLDDAVVVYRGATIECLLSGAGEEGPTFSRVEAVLSSGILSTSTRRAVARDFVDAGAPCCLFVLLLPSGTLGLYVGEGSVWGDEDELMLPHNTQVQIVAHEVRDDVSVYYGVVAKQ